MQPIDPSPRNASCANATTQASSSTISEPVLLIKPDKALSTFILTLLVYALVFIAFETATSLRPALLPSNLPPKKKYEVLFRFSRCLTWTLSALLALPSVPAMIDFIFNEDVVMALPSDFARRLLEYSLAFAVTPIFFDLCARRDIHWTTLVHHVATSLSCIVNFDWNVGTSIGVYHCTTCFFVLPLDFALGLCAMEADSQLCARWLNCAKFTGSSVYVFAQVCILRSLWKMFHAYAAMETYNETLLTTVFALGMVLDLVLVWTQWHLVNVLDSMAKRKLRAKKSA